MTDNITPNIGRKGNPEPQTDQASADRDYRSLPDAGPHGEPNKPFDLNAGGGAVEKAAPISPMEVLSKISASKQPLMTAPTMGAAEGALGALSHRFGQLGRVVKLVSDLSIKHPNAKVFREADRQLMQNKLSRAHNSLQAVFSHLGVSTAIKEPHLSGKSPMLQAFSWLTQSQDQLHSAYENAEQMGRDGKSLNPAAMLAVEAKMNSANQEIMLFTNALNKGLEAFKTIMGVQI
ncbi:hypothetical protein JYU14_02865 [Simkania negevensis]|uniref:Uncharacterized protein n=1 Tax=Simkania negevensis TaxID=83561 RepID=A0ABS3AU15_9BACT|nr:hypothetical protein [Simkania negevensis]